MTNAQQDDPLGLSNLGTFNIVPLSRQTIYLVVTEHEFTQREQDKYNALVADLGIRFVFMFGVARIAVAQNTADPDTAHESK